MPADGSSRTAGTEPVDLTAVLQGIVDGACAMVEARYGLVVMLDEEGAWVGHATVGLTAEERRSGEGWSPEHAERFMSHLRGLNGPLRVADWPAHLRSLGIDADAVVGRNAIVAPMDFAGRRFGYLLAGDSKSGAPFADMQAQTVHLFAAQAAATAAFALMQRAEQAAREEANAMLEAAPTALFVVYPRSSGRPPLANPSAKRLVAGLMDEGQSVGEFLRTASFRLANGKREVQREHGLTGQEFWAEEAEISTPDGRSIQVLASMSPVRSRSGEIVSTALALQDLKRIQGVRYRQNEFLAMVSHELRMPLASLQGAAAAALEDANRMERAEMRRFMEGIHEQAGAALRLAGDLLDFGRIRLGSLRVAPERSDVRDIVERARAQFANSGRAALFIRPSADLPPVMADPGRIAQVLANLIDNAARHTPEGSTIEVRAEHTRDEVEVSVRDEGEGFTEEEARSLFSRHAKSAQAPSLGDAGLGLAICRGLVEEHGGRIWAESPGRGQGAVITFTLPAAPADEAEPAAGASGPEAGSARVLVVDDDPQALRFIRDALRRQGHAPLVTGDHRDVPRLLRAKRPDLVLLDLVLRGANAIDLLERLPALGEVPVIIVSAYSGEESIEKALDLGAEDYIVKPVSETELTARVRAALRRRRKPASFTLGALAIDHGRRRVSVGQRTVALTNTEYEILSVLSRNAGNTVTHDELMRGIRGLRHSAGANPLRMHVSSLRRKLGDNAAKPSWIFSERSVGYRMASPDDLDVPDAVLTRAGSGPEPPE